MPELPEVETISRKLKPDLIGRTILSADLRWPRTLAFPSPRKFKAQVQGQKILEVGRRAKFLIVQLTDFQLLVHLRMSGDLSIRDSTIRPETHDRLVIKLSGDKSLVFNDTRKFGRVWLLADPAVLFRDLGPEPLSEDFTPGWLSAALRLRRRQLKPLLLDQSFLAGLGNIYADEALHLAGLHPLRTSDTINSAEAGRLHKAIRRTLEKGIEKNGASIDWVYRGGGFQNHFRVYGRTGQPCRKCGTPIERLLVGQRSTHFCPKCQPNEEEL
jgi:formamidopyrimidine-DNA glycosylase